MPLCGEAIRSSVRLLESSPGTLSTELLGLASSGISNDEELVVLEEDFLELSLGLLIVVLLIVCEECLCDGLSHSEDLVGLTTTLYSHSDVDVFKLVAADQENGLESLNSEGFGLDEAERLSVDSDGASAACAGCASSCVFLSTEGLNQSLLAHFARIYAM